MASKRQLHLGAFMRPTTIHTGAWRFPGAYPDANFNLAHLQGFAETLERGKFGSSLTHVLRLLRFVGCEVVVRPRQRRG